MLHDVWAEVHVLVDTIRADETCAEEGVIPVKDDRCLVLLRFVHWCQPYLFVCETREQILSKFIADAVSAHLIDS